jgi:hypothetical protein
MVAPLVVSGKFQYALVGGAQNSFPYELTTRLKVNRVLTDTILQKHYWKITSAHGKPKAFV